MKKIIVLAVFSFLLVVGLGGCKKEMVAPEVEKPEVFYSEWIKLEGNQTTSVSESRITKEIMTSGIIIAYYQYRDIEIFQLPIINTSLDPKSNNRNMVFYFHPGKIYFNYSSKADFHNEFGAVRYVIIPKGAI